MRIDWRDFGADVRRKRAAEKETVRKVAARLGISFATFWRAEGGKQVGAETFLLMCHDYLKRNPRTYVRSDG